MRRTHHGRPVASTSYHQHASPRALFLPGFLTLIVAKLADIGTTVIGLSLSGIREQNQLAQQMMVDTGTVWALVFLGLLVVLVATLIIEFLALEIYRRTRSTSMTMGIRALGYVPLTLLYFGAALQNAHLIAQTFSFRALLLL